MKAKPTLKERWNLPTPKKHKKIGVIFLFIAIIGTAITGAYEQLPDIFRQNIPQWATLTISCIGYVVRLILQFKYVNELFDKNEILKKQ